MLIEIKNIYQEKDWFDFRLKNSRSDVSIDLIKKFFHDRFSHSIFPALFIKIPEFY